MSGGLARLRQIRAQQSQAEQIEATPTISTKPVFHTDAREESYHSPDWLCRYCSNPLTIDDVCPSHDGARTLTLWHCGSCEVVGVTPDGIKKPPLVWVKTIQQ